MKNQKLQDEYLYDFLYVFFKRKYLAIALFTATFVGIVFGTFLVTPLWQATARVRVQYSPKQQLDMLQGITTPGAAVSGVNPANDVIQILTSRDFAERLSIKYGRDKLWEQRTNAPESVREIIRWHLKDFFIGRPIRFLQFLGILTDQPDNYLAMAVEELQEDLEEIELEEDTTVVNVAVWGESPEIATDLSNSLVQFLLEKNREASIAPINQVIKATQEQVAIAEQNLRTAQENLRRFKEKSNLILYDREADILLQRLDKYQGELSSLETEMSSLRIEKASGHPAVKTLDARIAEYRDVLIPNVKAELQRLPSKELSLIKLSMEMKVQEDGYTMLKQKMKDLVILRSSTLGDLELKVIDPARVYSYVRPDWPKMVVSIAIGIFASACASLFFIFLLEYWNSSFKSVKELEEGIQVPVLGSFPYFSKKMLLESLAVITNGYPRQPVPSSRILARYVTQPVSDTIKKFIPSLPGIIGADGAAQLPVSNAGRRHTRHHDIIADSMLLRNGKLDGKVFVIASPGRGEGKTTTCAVLSKNFFLRGTRVLLIDGNLRFPSLDGLLQQQGKKGLHDYAIGAAKIDEVIVDLGGVHAIFAGTSHGNTRKDAFEILSSGQMEALFQHARANYDCIFVDSPNLKSFPDALAVGAFADGVIVVIEADVTPKRTVLMTLHKLQEAGLELKGCILNKQRNYVPEVLRTLLY